jgi:hypothetical protein
LSQWEIAGARWWPTLQQIIEVSSKRTPSFLGRTPTAGPFKPIEQLHGLIRRKDTVRLGERRQLGAEFVPLGEDHAFIPAGKRGLEAGVDKRGGLDDDDIEALPGIPIAKPEM